MTTEPVFATSGFIASRCFNTPLAIHSGKAETILTTVVVPWLRGEPLARGPGSGRPSRGQSGAIAVLPISGTLVRRTGGMDAISGLQSYDDIRGMLRTAMADREVAGIVLDVDSPGGEIAGLADLADEIRSATVHKPIFAVADDHAFSAAYWLASAASRMFVTQTGGVGSIGIIAAHMDRSGFDQKVGLAYTVVAAGAQKADFSPHAPLSERAKSTLKAEVDRAYGLFVNAVARNRQLSAAKIRGTEAALYFGADAVKAGLADEIGTLDDAVAALGRHLSGASPGVKAVSTDHGVGRAGPPDVATFATAFWAKRARAEAEPASLADHHGQSTAKPAGAHPLSVEFAAEVYSQRARQAAGGPVT
jgi:signal peptide peptidase SppA